MPADWLATLRRLTEDREFDRLVEAVTTGPVPGTPAAELRLAQALSARHDHEAALDTIEALIVRHPGYAPAGAWRTALLDRLCRPAEAAAASAQALADFPDSAEVRVAAARLLIGRERPDEAVELLDPLLTGQDGSFDLAFWGASALRQARRREDAEAVARTYLAVHPDEPRSHTLLGQVLLDLERPTEAHEQAVAALALEPGHVDALLLTVNALVGAFRWKEAEERAADAVTARPRVPELHLAQARVLGGLGQQERALRAVRAALQLDERNPAAGTALLDKLADLRRWDAAEAAARDLISASPSDPEPLVWLGEVFSDQDRDEEALAAYEAALAVDPDYGWAARRRVDALRWLRRWEEAEEAARALIAADPGRTQHHVGLGRVLSGRNRDQEALAAFEAALALDPQDGDAIGRRLHCLRSLRRWPEAEAAARQAIAAHPANPDMYVRLGRVFSDQSRDEDGLAEFERALAIDPHHVSAAGKRIDVLRSLRRWVDAETAARDLVSARPSDPDAHLWLGWVFQEQGRDEEALAAFDRALAIDPQYDLAVRCRVDALRFLRRWEEAEEVARALIAARPGLPLAQVSLGWLLSDQGRHVEALAACDQALAIDPTHDWALGNRIGALRSLRRWEEAEAAARDLVSARPTEPGPLVRLGWVLNGQDRDEEALAAFEAALALDPHDDWAGRSRVDALRFLRRWDEAEAAGQALIAARPGRPASHVTLGWVLADQHRAEEALAAYEQALAIDPRFDWAVRYRIAALRGLRRWAQAESAAHQAIAAQPAHPDRYVSLGQILSDQGQLKEALAEFDRALALEPGHQRAAQSRIEVLSSLRRWEEAEAAVRELISARPWDPDPLVRLGGVLGEQDQDEEALVAFEAALALDPHDDWAGRRRVDALRWLRRWEEAEQAARAVIAARPRRPFSHLNLGWVLNDQGRRDEALAAFEAALAVDAHCIPAMSERVNSLRILRRWEEAEAAARAMVAFAPTAPEAYVRLGWVLNDQDRDDEALAAFEQAIASGPYAWGMRSRIDILRNLRRWAEAEAAARELIAVYPEDPHAHLALARVHQAQERYEPAQRSAQEARRRDPGSVIVREYEIRVHLALLEYTEAEDAARELIKERPYAVSSRLLLAEILDAQHRYDEALRVYEEVRTREPHHLSMNVAYSATLRSLRCFVEAEGLLQEAIARNPAEIELRYALAAVFTESGDFAAAMETADLLVELASCSREAGVAQTIRGWAALSAGDEIRAAEIFARAIELAPDEESAAAGHAWALLRLGGEQQLDRAHQLCVGLLKEHPHYHLAYTCLGMISYRRGQWAAAERHFRRSVDLAPSDGCHVDLGALYVQLGRFDEAETHLLRAAELDPWNPEAFVKLGSLRLHRAEAAPGDDTAKQNALLATADFRRVLAIAPGHVGASIGLAIALVMGPGDLAQAEGVLRASLRRNEGGSDRWQLHLSLSRLLIQSGDVDQDLDRYDSAAHEAVAAIRAAATQAECHFVAGVAEQRLSQHTSDVRSRIFHRHRALRHFRASRRRGADPVEVDLAIRLLEKQKHTARANGSRGVLLVGSAAAALLAVWVDFEWQHHVTAVMVTTLTPVLIGLMAIGFLMPLLVRVKLPGGMEADLTSSLDLLLKGPTGDFKLGSQQFRTFAGPTGQMPRLGQA